MVERSRPKGQINKIIKERINDSKIDVAVLAVPIDLYLADKHLLIDKLGKSYCVLEDGIDLDPRKKGYIELESGKEVAIGSGVKEANENLDLDGYDVSRYHLKIKLNGSVFTIEDNSADGTTVLYTE